MFWEGVEGRRPLPPAAASLNWEFVDADPEVGTIEVAFEATEAFTNPKGEVLGGFQAAMLYDTLGPALIATLGPAEFQVTLDLNTTFLRRTRPGRLTGKGRVVRRDGDIAFLSGTLTDARDTVIATATATAKVVPLQPQG